MAEGGPAVLIQGTEVQKSGVVAGRSQASSVLHLVERRFDDGQVKTHP